jgi:hypothetical protein
MKIGVLGTGMVGQAIASKLVELGHHVMMGSRSADNAKAAEWAPNGAARRRWNIRRGRGVSEVVFLHPGTSSLEALGGRRGNLGERCWSMWRTCCQPMRRTSIARRADSEPFRWPGWSRH